MKIRKSSIAAAVATLAAGAMLAVSTPAIAETPTLTVWLDSARKTTFAGPIDTWAKANGVTVTVLSKDFGTLSDLLKKAVSEGTGPDVVLGVAHDWIGNLVAGAAIKPINLSAATVSGLTSTSVGIFQSGGKQYGVPFYTENIALIRNLHVAPKAPTSGATIKDGELEVGYNTTNGDPYHFYPISSSFGVSVFVPTAKGWSATTGLAGNKGTEGTAYAKFLAAKGEKFFGKAGKGWNDLVCDLKNGKVKYWITGPWAINAIEGGNSSCTKPSVLGKDYAISAFPSFGGKTAHQFLGGKGGVLVNSPSTDTVRGTQLLTALASKEAGISFFNSDSFPPANKAALAVAVNDPVIAAFTAAGKNAVPMPNNALMSSVWDKWGKTELKLITGKSTNPTIDWKSLVEAETTLLKG